MKQVVYIIIVNWNGCSDTLRCLASIRRLKSTNIEITTVVVDNASTDDSVNVLKRAFPDVLLISNKKNLGFTGGNNVGMKFAMNSGANYIWLLNNDTQVDPSALTNICRSDNGTSHPLRGSKIYFEAGREFHASRYKERERGRVFWYAGGLVDWKNMYASHRGVDEVDHGQYDKEAETEFITGCSMLIHRSVVDTLGYFDDRYYLYYEDLEYCLRAKKHGIGCVYVPTSVIWHTNAGSTATPGNRLHDYYLTRNRLLLGMTYAPLRTRFALIREAVKMLFSSSPERKKAVTDFMLGHFGEGLVWQKYT